MNYIQHELSQQLLWMLIVAAPLARDKQGKYVHDAANTRYTTATSGQAKWGGMTWPGRDRLKELTDLITENRKEHHQEIQGIESHLLELVRAKNKRDEIDERKRQRRRAVVPVAEVQVEEVVDDAPDDFDKWWISHPPSLSFALLAVDPRCLGWFFGCGS